MFTCNFWEVLHSCFVLIHSYLTLVKHFVCCFGLRSTNSDFDMLEVLKSALNAHCKFSDFNVLSMYLCPRKMKYKYRPGTTTVLTKEVVPLKLEVVQETVQKMETTWTTTHDQHIHTIFVFCKSCSNRVSKKKKNRKTSLNFFFIMIFAASAWCGLINKL